MQQMATGWTVTVGKCRDFPSKQQLVAANYNIGSWLNQTNSWCAIKHPDQWPKLLKVRSIFRAWSLTECTECHNCEQLHRETSEIHFTAPIRTQSLLTSLLLEETLIVVSLGSFIWAEDKYIALQMSVSSFVWCSHKKISHDTLAMDIDPDIQSQVMSLKCAHQRTSYLWNFISCANVRRYLSTILFFFLNIMCH